MAFLAFLGLKVSGRLAYPVLFLLVGAETTGLPVPGETALVAAGILAHDGRLQLGLVLPIAAVAAIVGDNLGYLIGRTGGRKLLLRPGFLEDRRHELLEKGEPFFARHGPKAVFFGRWVAGLRIASAWLAGINRMHWATFFFWNALGGVAWVVSIGGLAYLLGPTAERIIKAVGLVGVGALVLMVLAALAYRHFGRRRQS